LLGALSANAEYNAALVIKKQVIVLVLLAQFTGKKRKKTISRKKVGQVMSELLSETSTISQEMTRGEMVSDIDTKGY
jgi:septum formation inhibitor-activating ATPase MinD